jgi:hypothetical protein
LIDRTRLELNKSLARRGSPFVAIKGASMWDYYNQATAWLFRLDSQEWFLAMCAALIIGFFALRGFGSRSNY